MPKNLDKNNTESKKISEKPVLDIHKIGIVTRNYNDTFPNGYRDFSHSLPSVLKFLDKEGCDAVLFSLYSIRKGYDPCSAFNDLESIKTIFFEEFDDDGEKRSPNHYAIYYYTLSCWNKYKLTQKFGSLKNTSLGKINNFVKEEMPARILGNCCVLLCGETNGVKYKKADKKIYDEFNLRQAIPGMTEIILNPLHDRMTRFEMKLKRKFLSENNRWVISVWNKGKQYKNGQTKDGSGPAWSIYHNGEPYEIAMSRDFGVEIGILDVSKVRSI